MTGQNVQPPASKENPVHVHEMVERYNASGGRIGYKMLSNGQKGN